MFLIQLQKSNLIKLVYVEISEIRQEKKRNY